jgi:trigger factor
VSDKENIQVTDDEIHAEIVKIAEETRRPVDAVKEVLNRESGMERLKGQVRNKKTLDFLQERASIRPAGNSG